MKIHHDTERLVVSEVKVKIDLAELWPKIKFRRLSKDQADFTTRKQPTKPLGKPSAVAADEQNAYLCFLKIQ